jgi:hypothetical protein
VKRLRVEGGAIAIELEGKIADPRDVEPLLELAMALRRALAGVLAQGPFR